MKIVVLLRYPKAEKSEWKRFIIEHLVNMNFQVSLVFGESSYLRHFKAALKYLNNPSLELKTKVKEKKIKLFDYFKGKIFVKNVKDLNSSKSERLLKSINPDLILLLGSGIIRKNILSIPHLGVIHCHHGYLPRFRGVNTAEWSFLMDGKVYLSTHYVTSGIDTGNILKRKEIKVNKIESIIELRELCRNESVDLILDTVKNIAKNPSLKGIKQYKKEGKQFFFMHPFFRELLKRKIRNINFNGKNKK